jgi:hypothetical protein
MLPAASQRRFVEGRVAHWAGVLIVPFWFIANSRFQRSASDATGRRFLAVALLALLVFVRDEHRRRDWLMGNMAPLRSAAKATPLQFLTFLRIEFKLLQKSKHLFVKRSCACDNGHERIVADVKKELIGTV